MLRQEELKFKTNLDCTAASGKKRSDGREGGKRELFLTSFLITPFLGSPLEIGFIARLRRGQNDSRHTSKPQELLADAAGASQL